MSGLLTLLALLVACIVLCAVLQRFAAVIMRIREPKTTALIFASGKMVCTGAKSEQDSKLAAKKVGDFSSMRWLYDALNTGMRHAVAALMQASSTHGAPSRHASSCMDVGAHVGVGVDAQIGVDGLLTMQCCVWLLCMPAVLPHCTAHRLPGCQDEGARPWLSPVPACICAAGCQPGLRKTFSSRPACQHNVNDAQPLQEPALIAVGGRTFVCACECA
jgi:hypothetical protein